MTFRVFFCAGVCGLLPSGGSFGTNAAGLPCPGDFFGTGTAWSSLPPPALLPGIPLEQVLPEQPDLFHTIPGNFPLNRHQLEQSGLFHTILQAFLWNGRWLK